MLRTLISITLLGSCCLAAPAPAPAAGSGSQKTDLFMPDIQVKQDDGYMCIPMKMAQDKSVFITGFEPKADMSISHHIILYGCEEAGDESGKPFSCTQMDHASADAKPTCSKGSAIIYAWAMGAPSFELPKDVAFKVGKDTKIKTLVLQMHFKFNGTYKGGSGLSMNIQDQPTQKIAGIYLMATGGFLPAQSKVTLETACQYSLPNTLTPFAYRVHTHTNGVVVSGYRVRRGKWVELGRKNPQLPQMFYPLTTPNIDIKTNDVLASRCVMKNTGESDIAIGATKNDEMCNFYIMYSVPNTPESEAVLNDDNGCFSDGLPYDAAEWRRDFGILTGFPADSLKVPEGDAKLAKTMGDHMQMGGMQMGGMQMGGMQMSDDDEDTENEYDESAIRNYLERFDAEEDADDENDNEEENDIFALRKRHFAASSDESE